MNRTKKLMSKRLPLPKGVVGGERGGRSDGKVGMGKEKVKSIADF